jgi:tripartite-type tricarboxylate transporter receptor subunit TctC
VTSAKRSPLFPDLPTLAETGVPGFHVVGWFGVFTTAKTPQAIVAKLNSEISAAVDEPEMRERLLAQGAVATPGSTDDLRKHLAREIAVWSKVIRDSGIQAE